MVFQNSKRSDLCQKHLDGNKLKTHPMQHDAGAKPEGGRSGFAHDHAEEKVRARRNNLPPPSRSTRQLRQLQPRKMLNHIQRMASE